jgi:ubiquinone/menaquinone biosynthesis C-methylase UbiE
MEYGRKMMPVTPDFDDPRYLNEVGWFLYREEHGYNHHTESYEAERLVWSEMLLDEFLRACGNDREWLGDKVAVSVGCGCSGDLAMWPAAIRIGVDPLVHTYQKLDMLVKEPKSRTPTIYLSTGAEDLPFVDNFADVIVCRNALDHMIDPKKGLEEIWRVLKNDGLFYLSVDVGGPATPDEPSPFTKTTLFALLNQDFETLSDSAGPAHGDMREVSIRLLLRRKGSPQSDLNKNQILSAYSSSIERSREVGTFRE